MAPDQPTPLAPPSRPTAALLAAPFTIFDTETTGVEYDESRIVTYAVGILHPDGTHGTEHGVINPGTEIPAGAARVHGWTTERVRAHPDALDPKEGAQRILDALDPARPVVAFNAQFDLTLLARELERHGLDPSPLERLRVIDPLVLDKHLEKYRKGSRRLQPVCEHHGVQLDGDWHDAAADAVAAGLLARTLLERMDRHPLYRFLAEDAGALHDHQVLWAREQAESLQAYFDRILRPAHVEPVWPIAPRRPKGATAR